MKLKYLFVIAAMFTTNLIKSIPKDIAKIRSLNLSKIEFASNVINEIKSKAKKGDLIAICHLVKYYIATNNIDCYKQNYKLNKWYAILKDLIQSESVCLENSNDLPLLVKEFQKNLTNEEIRFMKNAKQNLDGSLNDLEVSANEKAQKILSRAILANQYNLPCKISSEECYNKKLGWLKNRYEQLKKQRS